MYDNPIPITYSLGEHDFGAGGDSLGLKGPKGKQGELLEIVVAATETFTQDTTDAEVEVGTAADTDLYADFQLGALADTNAKSMSQESPTDLKQANIPADTQVEVTFKAPTGGTPAGKGHVFITILWW